MTRCTRFLLLFSLISAFYFISPAFALRPFLNTDSAIPLEKGDSYLESGFLYERYTSNSANDYQLSAEISFGLLTNLEFEVEIPYYILETDNIDNGGLGDVYLKFKLGLLKAREAIPLSLATELVVKLPTCNEDRLQDPVDKRPNRACTGESDVGFVALATKEFSSVTVHLNFGYYIIGDPAGVSMDNVLRYSVAIQDHSILPSVFTPMVELAGETQQRPSIAEAPLSVLVGLGYYAGKRIQLDTGVSFGITRASPDYSVTVGISYPFH